jgi:hypothetical protein
VAGGKERLSQPLAGQSPVARPSLTRQGGLKKLVFRRPDAVHVALESASRIRRGAV